MFSSFLKIAQKPKHFGVLQKFWFPFLFTSSKLSRFWLLEHAPSVGSPCSDPYVEAPQPPRAERRPWGVVGWQPGVVG